MYIHALKMQLYFTYDVYLSIFSYMTVSTPSHSVLPNHHPQTLSPGHETWVTIQLKHLFYSCIWFLCKTCGHFLSRDQLESQQNSETKYISKLFLYILNSHCFYEKQVCIIAIVCVPHCLQNNVCCIHKFEFLQNLL